MASLPKNLRKQLENAVKSARRVADKGARGALEELAIADADAPRSVREDETKRSLRNRLRAHGRQLGDKRDAQRGIQEVARLAAEVAYEHWHRLLFARFLAENDLLIEPSTNVAVSIGEVRELAREKNADWIDLAADWAQRMLPRIFRGGDPVLEVALPPEARLELEEIVEALERDVFVADDSLGWVYQFWQAERKDEINAREEKIGAGELPAVTQLFTEDYMVLFLLHNTLGAWWAGKVLARNPQLAVAAADENELRAACTVGEIDWAYLRFVRNDEGIWRPAAGIFDGWPLTAREIKLLDPCMGSGHFLVFALPIFAAMRMEEETLSKRDALFAVLRDNLHGLELDPRCTQIAAFNLALAAWKAIGHESAMPRLRLACSGLSVTASEKEWIDLTGAGSPWNGTMRQLHALFKEAPALGSLIDPRRVFGELFESTFEKVRPALQTALAKGHATLDEDEMAISAQGLLDAAELLTSRYTLVVTNVPYLGRGKQDEPLRAYCEKRHPQAKADLAACFVERCLSFCEEGGTTALVTQQTWLFLGTYKHLRKRLLEEIEWNAVARLGPRAFETISGERVDVALLALTARKADEGHAFAGWDASREKSVSGKHRALRDALERAQHVNQAAQARNPDSIVTLKDARLKVLLARFASNHQGLSTGDNERFRRWLWEVAEFGTTWVAEQTAPPATQLFGGKSGILRWEDGKGELWRFGRENVAALHNVDRRGEEAWGKAGVAIGQMRGLPATLYLGQHFDTSTAVLVPVNPAHLGALWAYCSSSDYYEEMRSLNAKMSVDNGYLTKVPFDLERWRLTAEREYPNGLPTPHTTDPTQWLFDGNPVIATSPLQVAVARLLGYRWPRQSGTTFPNCSPITPDAFERHRDLDGLVCLTMTKGEPSAADRLRAVLAGAYGTEWSPQKLNELLESADSAGMSLDDWLRDGFFAQHCDLFHQRPFIWQVWDGVKDGFSALVNYHKLASPNGEGRKTLEKLLYSYLGDWIERQRADQKRGVEGSDLKLAAAEHLARELEKILHGEPHYDIFVRWKPLHEQPIGWEPDINDGVRINIRPFMMARPFKAKAKNACILRTTPNIKWQKDRGKEPMRAKEDYPWFWGWDERTENFAGGADFDGKRWNDLHYTREIKERARRAKQ